jgi:hypothetical protein
MTGGYGLDSTASGRSLETKIVTNLQLLKKDSTPCSWFCSSLVLNFVIEHTVSFIYINTTSRLIIVHKCNLYAY